MHIFAEAFERHINHVLKNPWKLGYKERLQMYARKSKDKVTRDCIPLMQHLISISIRNYFFGKCLATRIQIKTTHVRMQ